MNISYRRTGGFAGMVISYDFATNTLTKEDAEEIQNMIVTADFFALPAEIPSDPMGADQFQYQLTVKTEEQQHSIQVGDAAVPDNLWPLINKIRILSRSN